MAPPPPPAPPYRLGKLGEENGRTGPFIEAFAVYLASYIGLGAVVHAVFGPGMGGVGQWLAFVAAPLGLLWPWLRGVRGDAWRRGFGWTRGRGVFREMISGVAAYVAGLPLIGIGIVIVVFLQKLTQTHPYHPIATETGDKGGLAAAINLLLIAAVAAPVIEETFFRGALFHPLRTRWSWVMAALISSLIFAGVHPQGMTGVPVLGTIAIVFCAMREWRSSIIASMTAHALNNGTLVLLLLIGTA
jgi:membrane protease YdiL (CAAX protease family)